MKKNQNFINKKSINEPFQMTSYHMYCYRDKNVNDEIEFDVKDLHNDIYTVRLIENQNATCSCTGNKNIIPTCIHSAWVLNKILKITKHDGPYEKSNFFNTYILTSDDVERAITEVNSMDRDKYRISDKWVPFYLQHNILNKTLLNNIPNYLKISDDEICPICLYSVKKLQFDCWGNEINRYKNNITTSCSLCNNLFHIECIVRWIADDHTTCVCCRGNIMNYEKIINDKDDINCCCGSIIKTKSLIAHLKTKKHLKYIKFNT